MSHLEPRYSATRRESSTGNPSGETEVHAMSEAARPLEDETALARRRLLDIHARCLADRYALFPRGAKQILAEGQGPAIVVFDNRGIGFPQQLDQIEHVVRLNCMRIAAVVVDSAGGAAPTAPAVRGYLTLPIDEFFARASEFQGCL